MGKKRYCWWKTFKFSGLVRIAMLAVPRQPSPRSCSRIFSFPSEVISSAASLQTVWSQPVSTGSPKKTKKSLAHGAGATTSALLPLSSLTLIAHCMGDWKRQTSKANPTQLPPHREDLSRSFCLLPQHHLQLCSHLPPHPPEGGCQKDLYIRWREFRIIWTMVAFCWLGLSLDPV